MEKTHYGRVYTEVSPPEVDRIWVRENMAVGTDHSDPHHRDAQNSSGIFRKRTVTPKIYPGSSGSLP